MHKLNLHCHSRYSDGNNTIKEIAVEYFNQGFPCAVITDHFYSEPELSKYSITKAKFLQQVMEANEVSASMNYPVIIGVELSWARQEEIVVIGQEAILHLFDTVGAHDLIKTRQEYECAMVLCHPHLDKYIDRTAAVIDGYEYYNHGAAMFDREYRRQVPIEFNGLTPYSNSDAHSIVSIGKYYNLIEEEIKSEKQLIKFIRSRPTNIKHISRKNYEGDTFIESPSY